MPLILGKRASPSSLNSCAPFKKAFLLFFKKKNLNLNKINQFIFLKNHTQIKLLFLDYVNFCYLLT